MAAKKEFQPIISEQLWAQAVGAEMLKIAKTQDWQQRVETLAVRLLADIQTILDDDSLDDAACFVRMEAVLATWSQAGLRTVRHRETE